MYANNKNKISKTLLITSVLSLSLIACSEEKKKAPLIKVPVQSYQQLKVLKGLIVNKKGSEITGKLTVADSTGKVVAKTQLENSRHYSVKIPAGTTLPVVLTVTEKGKTEKLRAVVISSSVSSYDVSLLTTKIAKRAKELGGYTYANMVMAADSTVGVPDANKTSTGFKGDPTKQYGGWH